MCELKWLKSATEASKLEFQIQHRGVYRQYTIQADADQTVWRCRLICMVAQPQIIQF